MDLNAIEKLLKLIDSSSLTHLEYQEGEMRLVLKKEKETTVISAASPATAVAAVAAAATAAAVTGTASAGGLVLGENDVLVKSPIVGTAYRSAEPGGAPLVSVGKHVEKDDPLLIIEAMKLFNEVKAPSAGVVKEILFEDGALAEFGAALVVIDTTK